MSEAQPPPDWPMIGGAIATVFGIIGAVVAGMKGVFNQSARGTNGEQERRSARDKDATANAALTLESVFRLVDQLQEEVDRKVAEIAHVETRCATRIKALEEKVSFLETKIGQLEHEIRTLKL